MQGDKDTGATVYGMPESVMVIDREGTHIGFLSDFEGDFDGKEGEVWVFPFILQV